MSMLEVENLCVSYGMIKAVQSVSFDVKEGEIVSLIGSNGAGKSSTLLALCGLLPSTGTVRFNGKDIAGEPPHRIVRGGMILVPEGRGTIGTLTVAENLEMGAYTRSSGWRSEMGGIYDRFPVLHERRDVMAQSMSGGEQQMLALARALLARPRLMLLDEPSMGLAPLMVARVFELIQELNSDGTTILLVEQNAKAALRISSRAYVLDSGRKIAEGDADVLATDRRINEAYLS
ncbi:MULTISPECIES: ABC transporter ATP-binding protein [unclassified Chelatococcus]|uniref:ABC transporter ATP-binding protein n=1 Tax=unclassified Chelatococcus TaxID=2638111 RepID=UPI001BCF636D|nr:MULTISPECIES: ABC transporter ATP-binding protein [unclassified Chelatococcus]CAH1655634.1 branched chain amino acid/phenylalanine ABC transporter ATP binding subunit LivF [Hyphomicrobiales bacterium]MBS7742581.1 ABC transporter ATP-binding protein [Chelatococcus sp. HY11]MBX3542301.1 ABC transporter ATP-binding protein [Chelatococcus sp.]MCO5075481.1 ABC transporter ATP-binding protein [Chelatococcus sp.]CAH1695580.1 branched chain amino acid/phenylalanine ABC transporter ATP binding subun